MDHHALEYYSIYSEKAPHGHFHRVIALHEEPIIDWDEASELSPCLCRGWYELSRLSTEDRIEFTRDFWMTKIPYHPHLQEFLFKFFSTLDDIGVYLTQQKFDDPFEAHLVYSLAENSGFYHGEAPADEREIIDLQKDFTGYILPVDYLAFLQIHNGFAKLTDTGLTRSTAMKDSYDAFQSMLTEDQVPVTTLKGAQVDPKALIPFYESFGLPFFQCFWGEWYPDQEMGNVYYSGLSKTISACVQADDCLETMAFETFTDWLMFYLEKID